MSTAVETFLGNLRRTLSGKEQRRPGGVSPMAYRVSSVNEPYVNQVLDRCLVLERVGAGAMSVVYKARQDVTDRMVAIKMLRAQLSADPSNVKRFEREAKAIARLSHPNLLNVYSVGQTESGQPFIVMDYVEGKSLADVVAQEKQLQWSRAASIFMQVCDAMQQAHANRIIHRDLKPDNIMLINNAAGEDVVKVVDFGIVKLTDTSQAMSQRLTQTGEIWGSPVYMSPEQCMGHDLDQRSDIYSLGTVMYECLTGKQLFDGKNITEIVMKQLNEKPAAFNTVRPDLQIPAWLERVVLVALEKDPKNRFASMDEMKREIQKGLLARKDTADLAKKPSAAEIIAAQQSSGAGARSLAGAYPEYHIGTVLGGKYNINGLIGEGGMSVVYRAMQEGINRPVAIKFLRDEMCDDESNVKRFRRESKAVSALSHPNLVAIYDVGLADTGQPYMVMEFLEGMPLNDVIEKEGRLNVERALPIFIQICDVMQYAHNKGFIHRDLKPHNIMLVKAGDKPDFVKLVDFGIVAVDGQLQQVSQKLTAAGEICGSPIYMSPEQVLDNPVDARSDIYSFGIVMYECLAGRPVFGGKRITDVMQKHLNSAPEPFSRVVPEAAIPPALEGVIFKVLEKNPDRRFQSMEDLKQALLKVVQRTDARPGSTSLGYHNPTKPPSGVQPAIPPTVQRHQEVVEKKTGGGLSPIAWIAIVVAGLLVIGGIFWFVVFAHQPPAKPTPPVVKKEQKGEPTKVVVEEKDTTVTIEKTKSATSATQKAGKPHHAASPQQRNVRDAQTMEAIEHSEVRGGSDNSYSWGGR